MIATRRATGLANGWLVALIFLVTAAAALAGFAPLFLCPNCEGIGDEHGPTPGPFMVCSTCEQTGKVPLFRKLSYRIPGK